MLVLERSVEEIVFLTILPNTIIPPEGLKIDIKILRTRDKIGNSIRGVKVGLGIGAPEYVRITRAELQNRIEKNNGGDDAKSQ